MAHLTDPNFVVIRRQSKTRIILEFFIRMLVRIRVNFARSDCRQRGLRCHFTKLAHVVDKNVDVVLGLEQVGIDM